MANILEFYSLFLFLPNFRHRRVILHWPTKFCQNRTTLGVVMMSYRFFKMAAGSNTGFDLDNIGPPTKCSCWSEFGPQKYGLDWIYSFRDIAIFIFCRFGFKLPIHTQCWEF